MGLGALTFDGSGDYVDVGIQAPLALAGSNYTIAWWNNWSGTTGATQRIINMDDGNNFSGGYSLLFARRESYDDTQQWRRSEC